MDQPSTQEIAYDEVPFPKEPRFWSEPAYLGAAAAMFGYAAPRIEGGRVLEVGCASGGNLLPMAARHPGTRFLGVDISSKQIAAAQAHAAELGLDNIEFRYMDIAQGVVDPAGFDYVIAHGVYSWIPAALQEPLFSFCAAALRERGLLYMSYNTLPYWHLKAPMRDILLLHGTDASDPREQFQTSLAHARELCADAPGIYGRVLAEELTYIEEQNPDYLLHEYFEADNHPVYVRDLIKQAQGHALTYVSEATPTYSSLRLLKRRVAERIARAAGDDRVLREQYIDVSIGRAFRRSVFVKGLQTAALPLDIVPSAIDDLHLLYMDLPPSLDYSDPDRALFYFDDALLEGGASGERSELSVLAEAAVARIAALLPSLAGTVPVRAVLESFTDLTRGDEARIDIVRAALLEYFYQRKITFTAVPLSWTYDVDRPRAQSMVVHDARNEHTHTVNVLHETIELKGRNGRILLGLLDGSLSRSELEAALLALYMRGEFSITRTDGDTAAVDAAPASTVGRYLDETLPKFAALRILTR